MSFAIEFFKVLPWQEYFATDFKLVGIITGLQLQWYTLDGDDVIVRKQSTAKDGEIVIAMTSDNEATCKRFYKEPEHKHYRLQPENDTMAPIYLDSVTILGKVIGLYRDHIF